MNKLYDTRQIDQPVLYGLGAVAGAVVSLCGGSLALSVLIGAGVTLIAAVAVLWLVIS